MKTNNELLSEIIGLHESKINPVSYEAKLLINKKILETMNEIKKRGVFKQFIREYEKENDIYNLTK